MGFEIIENLQKSHKREHVPVNGICLNSVVFGKLPFIRLTIGPGLARQSGMNNPTHKICLAFGTGSDAGKIQVSVNDADGMFIAKCSKAGNYALTINKDTADGLFAVVFPKYTIDHIEAIRPDNGNPRYFVFKASAPMLAVED